jgi:L-alanine-DL-glutamate epimerase-like enolase superfamily enzyme
MQGPTMEQTKIEVRNCAVQIEDVRVTVCTIPTDSPESDGTLQWDKTTIVIVELVAEGHAALGYTYAHPAAGVLIRDQLAGEVRGMNPLDIPACWRAMTTAVRNNGDTGLCRMAISAVDSALWDLKARLLELPLVKLLGAEREEVPAYGSGGFTSYSLKQLRGQLGGWAEAGFSMVKMKIGREPAEDPHRIEAARQAIGEDVSLFVDANGAYDVKQALALAASFPEWGVSWYEEPVWHEDLHGLHLVRRTAPPGVEVSVGEYGFTADDFRRVITAEAADVLQADATRCGITGFLQAATLCLAHHLPLSSHCAPSLHLPVCCAVPCLRHMEYFHDHVRIEQMLFDGAARAEEGMLRPDLDRPGLGLELKPDQVRRYQVEL